MAIDDGDLVWFGRQGREDIRARIGPLRGFEPFIAGVTERVVVQVGHRVDIFDPRNPDAPAVQGGPYVNVPVVVVMDGYWAGDPQPSNGSWIWRRYDWTGRPTATDPVEVSDPASRTNAPVPPPLLPIGETDGALVVFSRERNALLRIDQRSVSDIGPGRPVAAGPAGVALMRGDSLWYYPAASGPGVLLTDGLPWPTLAQTDGAGQLSPDGDMVAVLFADEHADAGSTLVVSGLDGDTSATELELPSPRATRVDWIDAGHVLVSGSSQPLIVNTQTMAVEQGPAVPAGVELHVI
ncbi:MAG: hypothetical protein M3Q39_12125 [Actinomycetota bacterium]|nr:hypothetical protein [Actinomycetota bacterium]